MSQVEMKRHQDELQHSRSKIEANFGKCAQALISDMGTADMQALEKELKQVVEWIQASLPLAMLRTGAKVKAAERRGALQSLAVCKVLLAFVFSCRITCLGELYAKLRHESVSSAGVCEDLGSFLSGR